MSSDFPVVSFLKQSSRVPLIGQQLQTIPVRFFCLPCLIYLQFFPSIADVPTLSFSPQLSQKLKLFPSNCFYQCFNVLLICALTSSSLLLTLCVQDIFKILLQNHISAASSLFCSFIIIIIIINYLFKVGIYISSNRKANSSLLQTKIF